MASRDIFGYTHSVNKYQQRRVSATHASAMPRQQKARAGNAYWQCVPAMRTAVRTDNVRQQCALLTRTANECRKHSPTSYANSERDRYVRKLQEPVPAPPRSGRRTLHGRRREPRNGFLQRRQHQLHPYPGILRQERQKPRPARLLEHRQVHRAENVRWPGDLQRAQREVPLGQVLHRFRSGHSLPSRPRG